MQKNLQEPDDAGLMDLYPRVIDRACRDRQGRAQQRSSSSVKAQEAASKRARAESPKIGACVGAAFYAVMRMRFNGRRNYQSAKARLLHGNKLFLLCKVALEQFSNYYTLR
jgi:hypothetical protein